ncbi:hypothetical protein SJAG_03420 [Schizosaccharomyces japonicus yFS275]|uniref:Uncharacterized protein n=1 Tax=Schizosaccharomyces japonicus (strain yFS275 / FY16936) TaxID=402676 RepID=B6K467_SCHJY|nr:hypothetical protein SJAG_03420 [Schizosaccharomyces japonicus yFS275]EEB08274.1 hypothetical protein SJAG_03420 [Schizosaccharomyces japonicus yFS275]
MPLKKKATPANAEEDKTDTDLTFSDAELVKVLIGRVAELENTLKYQQSITQDKFPMIRFKRDSDPKDFIDELDVYFSYNNFTSQQKRSKALASLPEEIRDRIITIKDAKELEWRQLLTEILAPEFRFYREQLFSATIKAREKGLSTFAVAYEKFVRAPGVTQDDIGLLLLYMTADKDAKEFLDRQNYLELDTEIVVRLLRFYDSRRQTNKFQGKDRFRGSYRRFNSNYQSTSDEITNTDNGKPFQKKKPAVDTFDITTDPKDEGKLHQHFYLSDQTTSVKALIDTGADECAMSDTFARHLNVKSYSTKTLTTRNPNGSILNAIVKTEMRIEIDKKTFKQHFWIIKDLNISGLEP